MDSFSLNTAPFENTLDQRFFYGGTTLMQRLDLLSHLTQFGESVILVSGPAGSGKSTLLDRFVSQAGSQWHLCVLNGDEFARFPEYLASALNSAAPASEQELISEWAARTDNSQLLVIVIDAAEQLDDDAFERLCALLESGQANRVRLILSGSPEAQQQHRQAFEQRQLPFTTQLLEMPRMSEEETAAYLTYRLAVAGYSGENPFTATEIRAICKASDGRPAAINRLAHEALLEHQARAGSKRGHRRKQPRKRGALLPVLGIAAVLVVAIWLGWQRFYPPATQQTPVAQVPMEERPLALPEPAPLAPPTPPATPATPPERQESAATATETGRPDTGTSPLAEVAADLNAAPTGPATREAPVEPPTAPDTDNGPLPAPAAVQPDAAVHASPPAPAEIVVTEEPATAAATDDTPAPETAAEPAAAEPAATEPAP
ncbi:MAG TPA: NACHT domain-containing protein, partial [Gammaproteobacteria bacterium]|nr:NACHT domain-containing protein [Gammaproteobacteria bacterium]